MKKFHLIDYQKYKNYQDNFLYKVFNIIIYIYISFILYYLIQLN